ncbi:hypothetical protein FSARC_6367 [Fusarium sarcochroum]|uniref:RFTS domain-containing protein n=1 Tax=Fusarium sarcochroum TaxID=1208366 RepID=A0A8H4X8I8_9HYPO|nr:hypothetical protein FSARC_6367 [Fusarium sarcochroum]
MVGRPRRASTSSVDTVDERRVRWCQEKSVLRYTPGGIDPENCFELKDAVVLNKDGQTLENALDVATRGPYIIRGTLLVEEPEQKAHLIMKVRSSTPLEVRKCGQYSIGEADDGSPIIWVEGKCAWFEINPSPAYAPIYSKMREAVVLYYRIMAIYRDKQPKKAKKSKKEILKELYHVFHQYAAMVGDGATLEEVMARCDEHASFLISQCTQDRSEVDWDATPFYKWLIDRHRDLYNKEIERLNNPPNPQRSPSVEVSAPSAPHLLPPRTRNGSSAPSITRSNATPEAAELEDSPPRKRSSRSRSATHRADDDASVLTGPSQLSRAASTITRPVSVNSATSTPSVAPRMSEISSSANDKDETPFQSVLNAVEWTFGEIAQSRDGVTLSRVVNKLWISYRFPNYKNKNKPRAPHRVPIEEVLHYNADALLQVLDKDKYSSHEFYGWLQGASKTPFNPVAIKATEFPYHLVRRKQSSNANSSKTTQPTPVVQVGAARSNLDDDFSSPARSSPAGKSIRRPGRPSGVKSSLRLATASKKRAHSDVDSDSEEEASGPKRSHYFSDEDDAMENGGRLSSSNDEASRETSQEPIKIILRADKIPTTVPRGPDETWVCEEEDCGYVVRGGDVRDCRKRIRSHFHEHEQQMDRVNLAMTEGTRGHLPVKYAYFPPFLILVELHNPVPPTTPAVVDDAGTAASTPTLANSPVPAIITRYQPQTPTPSPRRPSGHLMDKLKKLGETSEAAEQLMVDGIALPQRIKRNLLV